MKETMNHGRDDRRRGEKEDFFPLLACIHFLKFCIIFQIMQVNESSLEKTLSVYEIKQTSRIPKLFNSGLGISIIVFVCILLDFFFFQDHICEHM